MESELKKKPSTETDLKMKTNKTYQPGDGLRSVRTTNVFRAINFELYAKPNVVIMTIGLIAFGSTLAYITYMRSKYESAGYYAAIQKDGTEVYTKKNSRWDA